MKRQDAPLSHEDDLYNFKGSAMRALTSFYYSKTTISNANADSGNKKVSFIVDWQLQSKEVKGFEENSDHDIRTAFSKHTVELNEPDPDSVINAPTGHISGRNADFRVF